MDAKMRRTLVARAVAPGWGITFFLTCLLMFSHVQYLHRVELNHGDDDDAMHPLLYTSGVRVCVCIHIMRSLPVTPVPRWTRMTFPFSRVYLLTYLFLNIVLVAVVDYPEHTIS